MDFSKYNVAIFDLDGSILSTLEASRIERDFLVKHIDPKFSENAIEYAEIFTSKNPFDYPWVYEGRNSGFAEEPSYWRDAQAKHLHKLGYLNDVTDIGVFARQMYLETIKIDVDELMSEVDKFLRRLQFEGVSIYIVTNSQTEKANRVVKKLGLDITTYGDAKKFVVGQNHKVNIDGHVTYADRPEYDRIIMRIMQRENVEPAQMHFFGDMVTFDLLQPSLHGMKCYFKINSFEDGFRTPEPFIEFAKDSGFVTFENWTQDLLYE